MGLTAYSVAFYGVVLGDASDTLGTDEQRRVAAANGCRLVTLISDDYCTVALAVAESYTATSNLSGHSPNDRPIVELPREPAPSAVWADRLDAALAALGHTPTAPPRWYLSGVCIR